MMQRDLPNRLIVVRADGDVLVDPDVTQEHGLLISDKLGIAIPNIQQAVAYEWRDPDRPPVKAGGEYVVAHEPPPVTFQSRFLNWGLQAIFQAHFAGTTRAQRKEQKDATKWKAVWMALCAVVIVVGLVIVPILHPVATEGGDATAAQQASTGGANSGQ